MGAFVTYGSRSACDVAVQVLNDVYKFRSDARDPINVSHVRGGGGGSRSSAGPPSASSQSPYGAYGAYGYGGFPFGGMGGYPGYDTSAYSQVNARRDDRGSGGGL